MTTTSIIMTIICLALIAFCCWAIFKRANNDHKAKTQYDERQNVIRGRGYMFGFWTVLVFLGILFIMETFGITLPVAPFSLGFIGAILGATVMSVYTVWNGAYWGLNNNRKQSICTKFKFRPFHIALQRTYLFDKCFQVFQINQFTDIFVY